jgi:hypothetical protein
MALHRLELAFTHYWFVACSSNLCDRVYVGALLNYLSRLDFWVTLRCSPFASRERSLAFLVRGIVFRDPTSLTRSLLFAEQLVTWQAADVLLLQVHVSPLEVFVLVLPEFGLVVRKSGVNTLAFEFLEELVV